MKVRVFRFEQKGAVLFTGVLPASVLINESHMGVDHWTPSNADGYQRQLQDKRIGEVAFYLMKGEGWLPTSVLISARTDLDGLFTPSDEQGGVGYGELDVPDSEKLWIIDGQHRVAGLKRAIEKGQKELGEYMVPVTIVANPQKLEEVRMFYLVNSRAKSVPADIADRILQRTLQEKGALWIKETEAASDTKAEKALNQARATNVVEYLSKNSPVWNGFVEVPGEVKPHPKAIKQHTLVSSLLEGVFKDASIARWDDKAIGELLDRYWQALAAVFREAFDDPEHYSIRRTPGVYSLHMLFPDIFERCREVRDYSTEKMTGLIQAMGHDANFWHTDTNVGDPRTFGTGMKSLRLLADYLRSQLPGLTLAGM